MRDYGNGIENYTTTGFPSACAEFAEQSLSLDQAYDTIGPGKLRVIAPYDIPLFQIKAGDRLHVDKGAKIKNGMLCIVTLNGETGVFKKHQLGLSPARLTQEQLEEAECYAITGLSRPIDTDFLFSPSKSALPE